MRKLKRCLKKIVHYPRKFVSFVAEAFSTRKAHVLVTILEKSTGKEHHLLYNEEHVPCDECIVKLIGDTYDIPRRGLLVVERKPTTREVGQCTRPGKRGTWSIRRLTKV